MLRPRLHAAGQRDVPTGRRKLRGGPRHAHRIPGVSAGPGMHRFRDAFCGPQPAQGRGPGTSSSIPRRTRRIVSIGNNWIHITNCANRTPANSCLSNPGSSWKRNLGCGLTQAGQNDRWVWLYSWKARTGSAAWMMPPRLASAIRFRKVGSQRGLAAREHDVGHSELPEPIKDPFPRRGIQLLGEIPRVVRYSSVRNRCCSDTSAQGPFGRARWGGQ